MSFKENWKYRQLLFVQPFVPSGTSPPQSRSPSSAGVESHFSAVSEALVTLLVRPSPLTTRASIFTDAPESRFSVWVYGAFEASFQEPPSVRRSEEHTSELQSRGHLVCRLLLENKNTVQFP